jgi:hypothetical protein
MDHQGEKKKNLRKYHPRRKIQMEYPNLSLKNFHGPPMMENPEIMFKF